jgi:hypothetical protein
VGLDSERTPEDVGRAGAQHLPPAADVHHRPGSQDELGTGGGLCQHRPERVQVTRGVRLEGDDEAFLRQRLERAPEAGAKRSARPLVLLQPHELDRQRAGVALDEVWGLVGRAVVHDEHTGLRIAEQPAVALEVGEQPRHVLGLVVGRDHEGERVVGDERRRDALVGRQLDGELGWNRDRRHQ